MTHPLTSRLLLAPVLVTILVPATASAQVSAITNGQIFEALGVREGATVCEMGAGDGELTLAAARLVGTAGRVYSSELGEERVKALREKLARPARPIAARTACTASPQRRSLAN